MFVNRLQQNMGEGLLCNLHFIQCQEILDAKEVR